MPTPTEILQERLRERARLVKQAADEPTTPGADPQEEGDNNADDWDPPRIVVRCTAVSCLHNTRGYCAGSEGYTPVHISDEDGIAATQPRCSTHQPRF